MNGTVWYTVSVAIKQRLLLYCYPYLSTGGHTTFFFLLCQIWQQQQPYVDRSLSTELLTCLKSHFCPVATNGTETLLDCTFINSKSSGLISCATCSTAWTILALTIFSKSSVVKSTSACPNIWSLVKWYVCSFEGARTQTALQNSLIVQIAYTFLSRQGLLGKLELPLLVMLFDLIVSCLIKNLQVFS